MRATKQQLLDAFLLSLDEMLPGWECQKIKQEGNWNCERCDVCALNQFLTRAKNGEKPKVATQNNGKDYPKLR